MTETVPSSPSSPAAAAAPAPDVFELLGRRLSRFAAAAALIVVGALSVTHFYDLGYSSLHPWDECLYALRARAIIDRGMWLDQYPYCYGSHGQSGFYSGAFPPLVVWAMAICMKLLGLTTFAARLPSALCGMGAVWAMYRWGKEGWDRHTGVWGAFTLASWFVYMTYARRAQFDVPVTFFMILTVYWAMRYYKEGRLRWLIWAGGALGLGLMSKIVIAGFAAFALLLCGIVLWLRGELRFRRLLLDQVILNGVGVGLAAPWHVYMIVKYWPAPGGQLIKDNKFLEYFIGYHVFRRTTEALEVHYGQWWYYFALMAEKMTLLWVMLVGVACVWAVWRVARWTGTGVWARFGQPGRPQPAGDSPWRIKPVGWSEEHALLFPALWLVFVLGLHIIATSKRIVYLFPFTPPMAMLSARFLARYWTGAFPAWGRWGFLIATAILTFAWRSPSSIDACRAWYLTDYTPWHKALLIAREVAPLVVGGVLSAIAVDQLSRRVPWLRRFALFSVLVCFALVGSHKGLRQNFQRKAMREFNWAPVHAAIQQRDYKRVVYIGWVVEPDLDYYLNGINNGWWEGIGYQRFVPDYPPKVPPIAPDPDTLVILELGMPDDPDHPEPFVADALNGYELQPRPKNDHGKRHFAIYRTPRKAPVSGE